MALKEIPTLGPFVQHRYPLGDAAPAQPSPSASHSHRTVFEFLRTIGYDVSPGELGENIATAGLELERLPLGALLRLGASAAVALTGLRTPCVLINRHRAGLRRQVIRPDKSEPRFRCGVLGVIEAGGEFAAGGGSPSDQLIRPVH